MGGFTVRARRSGYDSGYLGVNLVQDTSVDFRLTPVMTTLAGTWAGSLSFSRSTTGAQTTTIAQATLTQTGASVSGSLTNQESFSGTLLDPSAIGSTTRITGTLTLVETLIGRNPIDCRGTGNFTGAINWTTMSVTVPQINLNCVGITYSDVTLSLVRQQ